MVFFGSVSERRRTNWFSVRETGFRSPAPSTA